MRRPSRRHCWSAPISADSACNIGRPKHPTPSWGERCSNPGENSGPDSDIRGRPGKLAQPPAIREQSSTQCLLECRPLRHYHENRWAGFGEEPQPPLKNWCSIRILQPRPMSTSPPSISARLPTTDPSAPPSSTPALERRNVTMPMETFKLSRDPDFVD